jgi:putative spermidine/putrescine transport system ATP-binding protein
MTLTNNHDLSIRSLSKKYDAHSNDYAVRDVDLEVRRGEFVALLGPSGSGKSTTLMMIAGFEGATSGDIMVDGRSIVNTPPDKRDIGVVFQNYALFPKMTVAQNIGFPLRMRGRPRAEIEATVAEYLDLIGLRGYDRRLPSQLSGGQQQRVALARALAFKPKLLLLDEPMGALDRSMREQLQLELKRIQQTLQITTIFVTHDQEEAMVLADRIVIMADGKAQQAGTPTEVYYRPANRFVAQFLGTANLLNGRVASFHDGNGLAEVDGANVPFSSEHQHQPGEDVCLFIRPECVDVAAPDAAALKGTVQTAIFVGSQSRLTVKTAEGKSVSVVISNRSSRPFHAAGDRVSLSWATADARAL